MPTVSAAAGCCRVPLLPQDLLIPRGQTLAELTAKDAAQVEQLMAAASAAHADAVAAITGQPAAARRSVGKPQGVSVSGGGEIEPTDDARAAAVAANKSLAGRHRTTFTVCVTVCRAALSMPWFIWIKDTATCETCARGAQLCLFQQPVADCGVPGFWDATPTRAEADNDLDRELLQHQQAQAASVAASSSSLVQRVRRFLKPPREELEAMPFGQRMQYEMVNSFLQVGL